MASVRLIIGLSLMLFGCASSDDKDTGSDDLGLNTCGISQGEVFDIEVGRVTLAPADSEGYRWDSQEVDSEWKSHLREWRDLSKTLSTNGSFERGSYEDVLTVNEYFQATLFSPDAAPDPMAVLYVSQNGGKRWTVAQEWGQIAGNTHELAGLYLGRRSLGGDNQVNLRLLDADAPDETRVGDVVITGVMAQAIANCGPMSMVRSETEMRALGSRVHAIEIEVSVVD